MKPGDKVIVTDLKYGHGFEIGEEVELVEYMEIGDDWICSNGKDIFLLTHEEFEGK